MIKRAGREAQSISPCSFAVLRRPLFVIIRPMSCAGSKFGDMQ